MRHQLQRGRLQVRDQAQQKEVCSSEMVSPGQGQDMVAEWLVLQQQCHSKVLYLTHTIPLAGHLSEYKAVSCVLQRLYWPIFEKDRAEYC